MSKYTFGVGVVNAKQTRDNRGRSIPEDQREYIAIEKVSGLTFETGTETRTLVGPDNFPIATATGAKTLTGTLNLYGDDLNFRALTEGVSIKNGATGIFWKYNTFSIPVGGSLTISPVDNGTFKEIVSVIYEAGAKKFKKVASAPGVGEYSVTSAGVLTFNEADVGKEVYVNYKYTTALGKSMMVVNMEMGSGTECMLELYFPKENKLVTFYNVVFGGISNDHQNGEFGTYSTNFSCSADSQDRVYSVDDLSLED